MDEGPFLRFDFIFKNSFWCSFNALFIENFLAIYFLGFNGEGPLYSFCMSYAPSSSELEMSNSLTLESSEN